MATSREDISRWFDAGVAKGATHMIVACDSFDHDDYPIYVMPGENVRSRTDQVGKESMQRVMEVYALHLSKAAQLGEHRAFHYDPPPLSPPEPPVLQGGGYRTAPKPDPNDESMFDLDAPIKQKTTPRGCKVCKG